MTDRLDRTEYKPSCFYVIGEKNMKNEFYYVQRFKDEKDFRKKLEKYIQYYNEKRIKKKLNWMSPIEFRNKAPLVA